MGDILIEKELEFDFSAAISAIQFDGVGHRMGHCMKAVDFLVEWEDEFWFVEVKDPSASSIPNKYKGQKLTLFINKMKNKTLFSGELGPKLKDSFLYRHLQNNLPNKSLKYLVILAIEPFDHALLASSTDQLRRSTCLLGPDNSVWPNKYIEAVALFNERTWNQVFTQCPVTRSGA
jgi:RNA recognition motif-containing protein